MVVCILTGCFLADNSAKMRPELVELPVQLGVIPKGPIFHVWFLRLVSSCQDFANTNKHPLEFQIWDVHTISGGFDEKNGGMETLLTLSEVKFLPGCDPVIFPWKKMYILKMMGGREQIVT